MRKGDVRREELLTTAEKLFYTKGYEKTSVQDILSEMNFSKGGFYHHFDSKLAVLEAICELRARETCKRAEQAMEKTEGTAADKLNAVFGKDLVGFFGIACTHNRVRLAAFGGDKSVHILDIHAVALKEAKHSCKSARMIGNSKSIYKTEICRMPFLVKKLLCLFGLVCDNTNDAVI